MGFIVKIMYILKILISLEIKLVTQLRRKLLNIYNRVIKEFYGLCLGEELDFEGMQIDRFVVVFDYQFLFGLKCFVKFNKVYLKLK